ncbi:hypothetical protein [Nocardia gipuzkoensis]
MSTYSKADVDALDRAHSIAGNLGRADAATSLLALRDRVTAQMDRESVAAELDLLAPFMDAARAAWVASHHHSPYPAVAFDELSRGLRVKYARIAKAAIAQYESQRATEAQKEGYL